MSNMYFCVHYADCGYSAKEGTQQLQCPECKGRVLEARRYKQFGDMLFVPVSFAGTVGAKGDINYVPEELVLEAAWVARLIRDTMDRFRLPWAPSTLSRREKVLHAMGLHEVMPDPRAILYIWDWVRMRPPSEGADAVLTFAQDRLNEITKKYRGVQSIGQAVDVVLKSDISVVESWMDTVREMGVDRIKEQYLWFMPGEDTEQILNRLESIKNILQ